MSANDPWFFDIEADTLGGERRSAQIVFVDADFRALELRSLSLMLDHAEVATIHIDQLDAVEMCVPGTLVYGYKFIEAFMNSRYSMNEMLGPWTEAYRVRLPSPIPVNRTPKPMKEPHRSDWAQRRPRRRRRR